MKNSITFDTKVSKVVLTGFIALALCFVSVFAFANTAEAKPNVTSAKASVVSAKTAKATISFKKEKNAVRYVIYRSTKKSSNYKQIASTAKNSYTDKNLVPNKTYYYKIKAYKKVKGKYKLISTSAIKQVKTPKYTKPANKTNSTTKNNTTANNKTNTNTTKKGYWVYNYVTQTTPAKTHKEPIYTIVVDKEAWEEGPYTNWTTHAQKGLKCVPAGYTTPIWHSCAEYGGDPDYGYLVWPVETPKGINQKCKNEFAQYLNEHIGIQYGHTTYYIHHEAETHQEITSYKTVIDVPAKTEKVLVKKWVEA